MAKPKYEPWSEEHQNKIHAKRAEKGFGSASKFSRALRERGLDMTDQSYLRRESGVTPVTTDEAWVFADTLGIPIEEVLELFSRRKDALKQI